MSQQTLRDKLWLWGMRVNALQETGSYSAGEEWQNSTLTTEQAIQRTGITNVLMAGGLPLTRETLDSMPSAKRIIAKWTLHSHSPEKGNYLDYDGCIRALRGAKELAAADTRVEAFLIDDFSTGTIDAGVKPEHLAQLQFVNAAEFPHLPLCGTTYTMSLDRPELPALLPYFAMLLVPLWHADQIETIPAALDRVSELSGGKPMLLCLYFWDFGNGRPIPRDLMLRHLEVGEMMLREKRVIGLEFTGTCLMDQDWEANHVFYEWLEEKGDKPIS